MGHVYNRFCFHWQGAQMGRVGYQKVHQDMCEHKPVKNIVISY